MPGGVEVPGRLDVTGGFKVPDGVSQDCAVRRSAGGGRTGLDTVGD